jgi:hypothetical protein
MNDARFMNEEQKEMLRQWNNLSPKVRQDIENHVLGRNGPILMTTRFSAVSMISEKQIDELLKTRTVKFEIIHEIDTYSKFTDVNTGDIFIYRGEYHPSS